MDGNNTFPSFVDLDNFLTKHNSNFIWLLVATILSCGWIIYLTYYNSRNIGLILTLIINRLYKDGYIHIGSFSFSVLSGKVMFRDVYYINQDMSIRIQDGFLIFRWWKMYNPKQKQHDPKAETRLYVTVNGFEFHVYNRTDLYAHLQKTFGLEPTLIPPKKEEDQEQDESNKTLESVNIKAESPDPTSSWRSLIPVIKVNISTGHLAFGNHHLPQTLCVNFEDAFLTYATKPPSSHLDQFMHIVKGSLENVRVMLVPSPRYLGLQNDEPPRLMGEGFVVLQSNDVDIYYYQDEPGLVPVEQESEEEAETCSEDDKLQDLPPCWGLDIVCGKGTDFNYGPWADRQRDCLWKFFLPADYQAMKVTEVAQPGKPRQIQAFELRMNIIADATIDLLFTKNRETNAIHVNVGAGSYLEVNIPMTVGENGYSPTIKGQLLHVDATSSMQYRTLLEAEMLAFHVIASYPRVWNMPQTWQCEIEVYKATYHFIYAQKNFFTDLIKDWASDSAPDIYSFVPYSWTFKILFHQFEMLWAANQHNWIDCSTKQQENVYLAACGETLIIDFTLPFNEFVPTTCHTRFSLKAEDTDMRLSLPECHPSRYPLLTLAKDYQNAKLPPDMFMPGENHGPPPPKLNKPRWRNITLAESGWVDCWSVPNFLLIIDYTWHPIYPQKADEQLKQSFSEMEESMLSALRPPEHSSGPHTTQPRHTSTTASNVHSRMPTDPSELPPDRLHVEMEMSPDSQIILYGPLLRTLISIKENYFGEDDMYTDFEEAVTSPVLSTATSSGLGWSPLGMEDSEHKETSDIHPLDLRPWDITVLINLYKVHGRLPIHCSSEGPEGPSGFLERLCFEMKKVYKETKLQLLLSPMHIFVSDNYQRPTADGVLRDGHLSLSGMQMRAHAMFSAQGLPLGSDTLEYAWLIDMQAGGLTGRITVPQLASMIEWGETFIFHVMSREFQLEQPKPTVICQHGVDRRTCDAKMPRGKSFRRSQAKKKWVAEQLAAPARPLLAPDGVPARRGTGFRYPVRRWPISPFTGRSHKLVIPPECPDKKFVLIVGCSHLRHLVDGIVPLPQGKFAFGISSTPGASAAELEREIANTQLDRTPSLVVLLAPSNNLTASRTVTEAAADFGRYLATVCSRWPKVCVLDFPPRLTVEVELQNYLSQEYHRVAARMGVKYYPTAEHFPMDRLNLWCKDGVHLSDTDGGMDILAQLLWNVSFQQLETATPRSPPVSPRSSPPTRRVTPKLVVTGPVPLPRPHPSEWTLVGRGKKNLPGSPAHSQGDPKRRRVLPQQVESVFSIPLTPVRFSRAILKEMDKVVPSDLGSAECTASFPAGKKVSRVRRQAAASQRSQPKRQVEAAKVVVVKARSPTSPSPAMVPDQREAEVVGVTPGTSPTSAVVILDTMAEEQTEPGVVGVTPGTSPTSADVDGLSAGVLVQDQMKRRKLVKEHTPKAARGQPKKTHLSCICCSNSFAVDGESADSGPSVFFGIDDVLLDKVVDCVADIVASEAETSDVKDIRAESDCASLPSNIRGSFHQAYGLFKYPGVQCMPIALVSLAKHTLVSVFLWQQADLDCAVLSGDALYIDCREKKLITPGSNMLIVPNLPKKWNVDGHSLNFVYGDEVTGLVDVDSGPLIDNGVLVSLESGLNRMLAQYSTCLFTVCNNTCAIISEKGSYAVVDSHARSATGMVDPDGTSVVVYFSCMSDLLGHFRRLAGAFYVREKFFEIVGVSISVESGNLQIGSVHQSVISVKRTSEVKSPNVAVTPRKLKRFDDANADVEFVSEDINKMYFSPISQEVSKALCKLVNVEFEKSNAPVSTDCLELGPPCLNEAIVADGNCYFRAISQAISGSQKNHRKIRLAVVQELEKNAVKYQRLLREGYFSVGDYISAKKMRYVNTWATEVEIQVTADYLGVDVFTFVDGRWVKYGCCDKHLSSQGIYLENRGNHYETVICVKVPNAENCYCYCDSNTSSVLNYNDRSKVKPEIQASSLILEAVTRKFHRSKYIEKKRKLKMKIKYQEDDIIREMCKQKSQDKYMEDNAYREKKKDESRNKYRKQVEYREKVKETLRKKYEEEEMYKDNCKEKSKSKYRDDFLHKEKLKEVSKEKYSKNESHRQRVKALSVDKYSKNESHRQRVKALSVDKYCKDESHRQKVKALSVDKYSINESHRQKVKTLSIEKYNKNESHRNIIKTRSTEQYRSLSFRQKVKGMRKAKYHKNTEHRNSKLVATKSRREQSKSERKNFKKVMKQFIENVKDGPECVCCVCFRLCFKRQVRSCHKEGYAQMIADKCISEKYLHKCSKECEMPCKVMDTARGGLWICSCCHKKLKNGRVPPECFINNLELDDIPEVLACLNDLEEHLVSPSITFMKVLALPKGGQNGVHGPITCVPANITQTTNLLPRSAMNGSLLRVKLKRKLTYKGHYKYQFVDVMRIKQALQYLKQVNKHFKDIEFNEAWINEFVKEHKELDEFFQNQNNVDEFFKTDESCYTQDKGLGNKTNKTSEGATETAEVDDELLHDRQQYCIFQDTWSMPVDLGQEILDQYLTDILNLAPAEGNNPVHILSDKDNEARCFPFLFILGRNTFHERRQYPITLCRYLNNRIMHADGRFARCLVYLFFAQYILILQQVISNVSVALRKGHSNNTSQKVCDEQLNTKEILKNMLEVDVCYRILKAIRGTPAFWQTAQSDLLAMVRQLSVATWFCSFSSADLRWKDLLDTILRQEGRTQTAEDLEWSEKCELLRRNPVTAARMFDYRWHLFLKFVLMSPAHPIGKITHYFYRVEFQQRGSPHVHCLFWIEGAPKIYKNTDEEVVSFIDKYITCERPPENDKLFEIVTSVQQHSKRHSKTCKKGNTVCRFNFPRPVSARTFIKKVEIKSKCAYCQTKEKDDENVNDEGQCTCEPDKPKLFTREEAVAMMTAIKKVVSDENCPYNSPESVFASLGINQAIFEEAYKCCGGRTQVVLKRQVNEVWVNQYNRNVLECWNANLDIQFVVDVYACIVYIISYISKSEREMGLLLNNALKEAKKGNLDAKLAMKKLGSIYLHNRDVSAQEAVYYVTNMHLKESARKVVFIPTGDNIIRMSKPISEISESDSEEDIWMINIIDRYKNRPKDSTFNDMCIATFASEYRLLSKSEKCKKPIQLENDCGVITKRTRTKPAIVRYARFSETKNPELFHKSMIQLFLPYREELKPCEWETFVQFFENGSVCFCDGSSHSVKSVVRLNRSKFEVETEDLEKLQNEVDCEEVLEDAWCLLCPEQEVERLECVDELKQRGSEQLEDEVEHIPDLAVVHEEVGHLEKCNNVLSRNDGLVLIRSLNELQLEIFYKIRQWCLDKVCGKNPEPFHVFITGGAGTGKSHLIRAIQYEAMRLLAPISRHPDSITVLLTAPTGIAAYNLKAATIHTTFHIGTNIRLPYTPLGEEKLNSLRAKYSELQILIIDEISMVHHKLLAYIHGRLRQIKQTGDFSPFGKVCIVAVGDFFQLAPVKGKALFVENIGVNLWTNFSIVELKTIMRQKDDSFAQLLNRLRTRSKGTPMLKSDIEILKRCETGEQSSALHIFPTNSQVFEHNFNELQNCCDDYIQIDARDYGLNKKTGKLELKGIAHSDTKHTCLPEQLLLGRNARVMLCKNIDVNDGLVNGLCGTVKDIIQSGKKFPEAIYVLFDDSNAGADKRKRSTYPSPDLVGCTRIEPEEERANNKGGVRRQFPLKLAWACTVHKVQGISIDKAVVSLKKIFTAGQAYVALSRVRTLEGLIIQDFNEKAIFCNENIKYALHCMPPFLTQSMLRPNSSTSTFTLFVMNVQGLARHVSDLASCTQHWQPNCIAVTETWLSAESCLQTVQIDGFIFHSSPRSHCYRTSTHPALTDLRGQQHGGVGMYCDENVAHEVTVPDFNLECLIVNCMAYKILVVVIYRPPSYAMSLFKPNLEALLNWLDSQSDTIAIVGDFNDDILKSSNFSKFMTKKGFSQYVVSPTTEKGTLIDHAYVKTSAFEVESTVVPAYFSDHEGILCSFKYNQTL